MSTKIQYRLKFISDWHIGSGSGIPGLVDNGVLKDGSRSPMVTGKTIKGIVRDALEDILHLNQGAGGQESIDDIFGREGDRAGSAVFFNPQLVEAADAPDGDIRSHTAIDRDKGTARKHQLYSEETSPQSLSYRGEIEVDDGFTGYILAALRFVTKIGGKRRRGLGQCEFEIAAPQDYGSRIEEFLNEISKN